MAPLPRVQSLPPAQGWEEQPVRRSAPKREQPAVGTSYTVQKGDTLQKIASKIYGSSKNWHRIYEANQDTLKGPDRITVGQKLVIPPAESTGGSGTGSEYK